MSRRSQWTPAMEAWMETNGWPPDDPRCYSLIPVATRQALDGWANGTRLRPGSFIEAVLRGERLSVLVGYADDGNLRALPAIGSYIANKMPAACHGCDENFSTWRLNFDVANYPE